MARRGPSVVFVITVIVIAGCTGAPNSTSSKPASLTTSSNLPAGHPSINGSNTADGTSQVNWTKMETLTQPTVLTLSHASQISGQGYHIEVTTRNVKGESQFNQSSMRLSNPQENRLYAEIKTVNSSEYIYQNASKVYMKSVNGSGTTYDTQTVEVNFETVHRQAALVQSLSKILHSGTYDRTSVEHRGQISTATYTLRNFSLNETGNVSLTRSSGEVKLTSEGLVRYAAIDVEGTRNGTTIGQHIEYEVVERGNVSISSPSWLESAS